MDFFAKQLAYKSTFGERLTQARTHLKFSQEALAEVIGTTPRSISRWEHNKTIPRQYYWQRLYEVLQISPEAFFGKSERKMRSNKHRSFLWHVPYARNSYFTGREEILKRLHERLHSNHQADWARPQILTGLGGIGKTQIALEYAYRFHSDYQAILWVRAETSETFLSDYIGLVDRLQISQKDALDHTSKKQAVKHWFQSHSNWLLIIDGLENLKLLDTMLPKTNQGHILIITRSQITGSLGFPITVQKMNLTESVMFLLRRAGFLLSDMPLENMPASLHTQAEVLGKLLDGFPLALDQAGAYIEESACGLSGYLERYKMQQSVLLNYRGMTDNCHPDTVNSTLVACFRKMEQDSPLAANLLRLCAFLPSGSISEELLTRHGERFGSALQALSDSPLLLDKLVRELRCFSLLHRDVTTGTLCIHRLLQVVIQNAMDEDERKYWTECASQIIDSQTSSEVVDGQYK